MRTLSTFRMGVEQPSPLSVFRPDDFSTRLQLTSPCDTVPRSDKSCSAGVIRAASWPSFCFVFLTGRQHRLISRSATLISSAQYDNSLGKDNYRWISSHEASRVDAAPQMSSYPQGSTSRLTSPSCPQDRRPTCRSSAGNL